MLKLFGSSLINSNPQNLVRSSCFSYVTSVFESHDLRKLCKIMNQPVKNK